MKIDYKKTEQFAQQLQAMYKELSYQQEVLHEERIKLSSNSDVDNIIVDMKKTEDKIGLRLISLIQMQRALHKISMLYKEAEDRIEARADSGWKIEKQSFSDISRINVDTDITWRVI